MKIEIDNKSELQEFKHVEKAVRRRHDELIVARMRDPSNFCAVEWGLDRELAHLKKALDRIGRAVGDFETALSRSRRKTNAN